MLSEAKVGGLVERQGRHKTVPDGSYIIISAYSRSYRASYVPSQKLQHVRCANLAKISFDVT